jgi:hypothetical protein
MEAAPYSGLRLHSNSRRPVHVLGRSQVACCTWQPDVRHNYGMTGPLHSSGGSCCAASSHPSCSWGHSLHAWAGCCPKASRPRCFRCMCRSYTDEPQCWRPLVKPPWTRHTPCRPLLTSTIKQRGGLGCLSMQELLSWTCSAAFAGRVDASPVATDGLQLLISFQ